MNALSQTDWQTLVPFDRREGVTLKQAAGIAGKSESTLRGWCERHGLGRRVGGGTWVVSRVALAMFLDGNRRALTAYLAGRRTEDAVAAYFRRLGLEMLLFETAAPGGAGARSQATDLGRSRST